jgi:hypothetical protein
MNSNKVKQSLMDDERWIQLFIRLNAQRLSFRIKKYNDSMTLGWHHSLSEINTVDILLHKQDNILYSEIEWVDIEGKHDETIVNKEYKIVTYKDFFRIIGYERKGFDLSNKLIDKGYMEDLINKRKKLHPNDPEVYRYWAKIASILSIDFKQTINFLKGTDSTVVYWIAEVFEDIAYNLDDIRFINELKEIQSIHHKIDLSVDIGFAEEMLKK